MRRPVVDPGPVPSRTLAALVLTALTVSGCSQDPAPEEAGGDPSPVATAATSSSSADGEGATGSSGAPEASGDTYADVADPASVPLDADLVEGLDAISVWEGTDVQDEPGYIGGELFLGPGRSLVTLVSERADFLSEGSPEAQLRKWRRDNVVSNGPARELDPVVVDGVEMLRGRAEGPALVGDVFIVAQEDLAIEVLITTPTDFSEAEREEAIGQVMATVELDERW